MGMRRANGAVTALALSGFLMAGCSGHSGAGVTGTTHVVATFTTADASPRQLTEDAAVLTDRLHRLDDPGAVTDVRGRKIVILTKNRLNTPLSALVVRGFFQVRPALCQSGPFTASSSATTETPVPSNCSSERYSLQVPNLTVDDSIGTSNVASIAPDPALASFPSSSPAYDDSHPGAPVLVPASGDPGVRYLLGPTELNGSAVANATATFQNPNWVVDVNLTKTGGPLWDAVAEKNFHELVAFDVDGQALSVPLTQPSQATFTSFAGRLQISGTFTRKSARQLAAVLDSGPLASPLSGATLSG